MTSILCRRYVARTTVSLYHRNRVHVITQQRNLISNCTCWHHYLYGGNSTSSTTLFQNQQQVPILTIQNGFHTIHFHGIFFNDNNMQQKQKQKQEQQQQQQQQQHRAISSATSVVASTERTATVATTAARSNKFGSANILTQFYQSALKRIKRGTKRSVVVNQPPTETSVSVQVPTRYGQVIESEDGRKFAAFEIAQQKLKPYIIKRRLKQMRTYVGTEKNIRHSPWRLNLVCQFAAGKTLQDAMNQLEFCKKKMAPLVQKVLKRTSNLADIRHGLQMSQLEVAECFATKGTPLKRAKFMGRGRTGLKERKHSHFRVVLREIDFQLRLYQSRSIGQKKRWYMLQQRALQDSERAKVEREEITRLEERHRASVLAAEKVEKTNSATKKN